MAEVLRKHGFIFRIWPNDHPPAHVHVYKAEAEITINVGGAVTAPSFRKNRRMTKKNAFTALGIVAENQELFLTKWRKIHG